MFIDFSVREDCQNLLDSYGEICVQCNCCGRFDENTKYEAQLETHKEHLQENLEFNNWIEGFEETQKTNIKKNIEQLEADIKYVEGKILEKKHQLLEQK